MSVLWFRNPQDMQERFEIQLPMETNHYSPHRSSAANKATRTPMRIVIIATLVPFVLLFVGIHLAAWNYPFLSAAEAWV